MNPKVVLTDHPWPDVDIEQSIFDAAGVDLIAGPIETPAGEAVDAIVAKHKPQAIMCCWAQVSRQAILAAGDLKIVSRMGVGLDNIAVAAATERGAWVTNVPDYCVEEVSDHAVAMVLSHWRGIVHFDQEAKAGKWEPASAKLKRVRNMTVGVIGYGRIGQATARKLAEGFGVRVLASTPSLLREHREGAKLAPNIAVASIATLQAQADAIILNLPLTSSNKHLIDASFLSSVKRKPLIVNVSRGGLIDHVALLAALDAKQIAGAALDVIDGEPAPPMEIMGRRDVIVTPHVAFSSDASLAELRQRCAEEVVRVLKGERPLHPCNSPGA